MSLMEVRSMLMSELLNFLGTISRHDVIPTQATGICFRAAY